MWRIPFYGYPIAGILLVYWVAHFGTDITAPFFGEIQVSDSARVVSIQGESIR